MQPSLVLFFTAAATAFPSFTNAAKLFRRQAGTPATTGGHIGVAPPPNQNGFMRCQSGRTDDCGKEGLPHCCYKPYDGISCFEGDLYWPGDDFDDGEAFDWAEEVRHKAGCSCPKGCTTGDGGEDDKGQCV